MLDDAQVRHNQVLQQFDHGDGGTVRLARSAAQFVGTESPPLRPAPHLGEQGREVLAELGLDAAAIDALLADACCGAAGGVAAATPE